MFTKGQLLKYIKLFCFKFEWGVKTMKEMYTMAKSQDNDSISVSLA